MIKTDNIPKHNPKVYTEIALNDLVTYAVYYLSESGEKISAENITALCFLLFPERFSLRGYPQWPDSTVVNKRWIDCRNKGYITGSTAQDFSLAPKGLVLAERVEKILSGSRPLIKSPTSRIARTETRTRAGRFVRALVESEAYEKYKKNGEHAIISEFDFRSMLLCTMESTAETISKNLEQFKQHAKVYNREDLVLFLDFCEKKFHQILKGPPKPLSAAGRGMMQRKRKEEE